MDELVLDPNLSGILLISDVQYVLAVADTAGQPSATTLPHEETLLVQA
jgi:hypothetical protein